ncbi:MAG: carbamoyl-phosphate synthase large subunit [Actinobacteria bacterium]|nr:carbamoyl-phosphate synthase large subunit [Actinomycetota bacterium]
MPARDDIDTVLVLGSGPIVIGQACEFDYSGAQACKVLRREGYRVVLVNSNPATIMTDPAFADATYVEPLTVDMVTKVIAREAQRAGEGERQRAGGRGAAGEGERQRAGGRGSGGRMALLPTLGGQTGLNVAMDLAHAGVLERYGVEQLGAGLDSISVAEDRRQFADAMAEIGLAVARSGEARDLATARELAAQMGFPVLVRSSFTLGGAGSGVADDPATLDRLVTEGLAASPIGQVQIDESLLGWKEYELEVMRDHADNCVVVCTIENLDPMGVHTGDSITVAPAMTLSDVEFQQLRNASFAVMRRIGVETGGSNVQFAVDPTSGSIRVVEMNPRVSRSSALASKATGFPIAKIAALLAVGYRLDEIPNDITGATLAAFEPSIDYVVTKIPRFNFEKFPGVDGHLTTRMHSVGEVMAIGRTFTESLGKALRSLEDGTVGLTGAVDRRDGAALEAALRTPTATRLHDVDAALSRGWTTDRVAELTGYDPWFCDQLAQIVELRRALRACETLDNVDPWLLRRAKRAGFGDAMIAGLFGVDEASVRRRRRALGITPVFKTVDTCAAEFAATTPYHYSTYEDTTEVIHSDRPRIMILGSGPNRIGQGIEFDYCCVHAVQALSDAGYETIMVNCNPETVSTDYDTADRLYFEPLTVEDVLAVHDAEVAAGADDIGVMVQFGGQTPLKLAHALEAEGVRILGTAPEAIDRAEDRGRFGDLLSALAIRQPDGDVAATHDEAIAVAARIGFPVLLRPSYVLGGRAMAIVYDTDQLRDWLQANAAEGAVLVDRFLESAVELDVDAVYDGHELFVGGITEHIEEAGVHSGDSACVLPPFTLGRAQVSLLRDQTAMIADALHTRGLINIQFALRDEVTLVLEANPRASRTTPFVSKATGVPLAKLAARVMAGATLADLRDEGLAPPLDMAQAPPLPYTAVKEAVLPFNRFPGVDTRLGPEMRSTGEVMGIDERFGVAFAKSQAGTGAMVLPEKGTVFVSIANRDKRALIFPVKRLADLGFEILATEGTAATLRRSGVAAQVVAKHSEGVADGRSTIVDRIEAGDVDLVFNTPRGGIGPRADGYEIRTAAVRHGVPCITTLSGILAAIQGIEALRDGAVGVRSLQQFHADAVRGFDSAPVGRRS